MIIPKELKIGGVVWNIQESSDVANEGDCFASTHFRKQKIFIAPDETDQRKEISLFHEIIHVLLHQSGYSERMNEVQGIKEEELAKLFSHGFYQVLKDNDLLK